MRTSKVMEYARHYMNASCARHYMYASKPVETRDRPLNANAKVFTQTRGTKDPKDGKSRLENSTTKGEVREIHEYKRKLSMMQAQVKEIQDTLDGKDPCDFNWTPPSVSKDVAWAKISHSAFTQKERGDV